LNFATRSAKSGTTYSFAEGLGAAADCGLPAAAEKAAANASTPTAQNRPAEFLVIG
jgi:hypothetical protein